ncbi:hypothetical protein F4805DRAFT_452400 [Annulohypoxylon moriforme]|nr:hypothetical protein F4805DRAFT_452400 [Annulohypoxylon moriforme]
MDGLNDYRTARVADILSDFRNLQYYIAAAPVDPPNGEDYYTEGWAALRQCAMDGQHILNCAADVTVPQANGGEAEQQRAELKQILLDAFSRRHEGQKIYLRQAAAQRWIEYRDSVLQGQRPNSSHRRQLRACDEQLRGVRNFHESQTNSSIKNFRPPTCRWAAGRPKTLVSGLFSAGCGHARKQLNRHFEADYNTL